MVIEDDTRHEHSRDDAVSILTAGIHGSWRASSEEECFEKLGEDAFPRGDGMYCNATWDTLLCWPATLAGATRKLPCPPLAGLDPTEFGYRKCSLDGRWEGRTPGDYSNPRGYTNYVDCYTDEALEVYHKYFGNKTVEEKRAIKDVAIGARTMEIIGLNLSLVSCFLSLFIFSYFRSLRCHRTKIHRNLFIAIVVQDMTRLIIYLDQYISKSYGPQHAFIVDMGAGCELVYFLLEYTRTVKFMWMFLEGLYLHNMIAITVFSRKPNYKLFYALGWGSPIIVTSIWAVAMHLAGKFHCIHMVTYYHNDYIWINEGPRAIVIVVNFAFLVNIMRVLVTKLRETHTTEAETLRKAAKAAIVLLPLLGITNFLVMIDVDSDNLIAFGIWTYTSYFFITFQGFFISTIYCFLNGESRGSVTAPSTQPNGNITEIESKEVQSLTDAPV